MNCFLLISIKVQVYLQLILQMTMHKSFRHVYFTNTTFYLLYNKTQTDVVVHAYGII